MRGHSTLLLRTTGVRTTGGDLSVRDVGSLQIYFLNESDFFWRIAIRKSLQRAAHAAAAPPGWYQPTLYREYVVWEYRTHLYMYVCLVDRLK